MDETLSPSKKRKRGAQNEDLTAPSSHPSKSAAVGSSTPGRRVAEGATVRLALSEETSASRTLGPIFASFPSVQPPQSTAFTQWVRPSKFVHDNNNDINLDEQPNFVFGETEKMQFQSGNHEETYPDYASHYMIGVYDKSTNTVTLRPAHLHVVTAEVTALKGVEMISSKSDQVHARHALGEAFGTRKSQLAIRSAERNKVDISAMEDVAEHLQESIAAATGSLPTQEQTTATTDLNRPIPPVNLNATTPEEAYPLHSIVSENELDSIPLSSLLAASSEKDRRSLLPSHKSNWINGHLADIFKADKPSKSNLKILYYISCMIGFKNAFFKPQDKAALQEKLPMVPSVIIDGLLANFTQTSRNSSQPRMTPHTGAKLLNYIFALCLKLDDYSSNIAILAADLHMATTKVETHFKSLGCKIESPTARQREILKLSVADAKAAKCATLKIPLVFPKPKSGVKK